MVTTIGRVFAERFVDQFGLVLKEPPLPVVNLETTIVWSRVRGSDPVLAWLRGVIREVGAQRMSLSEKGASNARQTRVSRKAEKL
jgi:hypothetical protein